MSDHKAPAEATREYAAAYAAHYSARDLPTALDLYEKLMASHASAPEVGYSRSQIQNIVKLVVPEQELMDAQMELARICLGRPEPTDAESIPAGPPAPEQTE